MTEEKKVEETVEVTPVEETKVEETSVEVPAKFADLVKTIETLSVIELSELVKVLEDKFGVSAAAPAMMMAGPALGGAEAPAVEEKSEFNVELTDFGATKIAVIKAVKVITGLGLADAKGLVDNAPSVIKENVKKEEAEAMKAQIEEAGGKVELK
ncbi:MAG: 50S ribosomal protein L7/L12 [Candidatus Magasanikbacteria bacterium]|nr:50S ribosomal protein L7/L12 [Candidatus Magasanikbacteria bacterium]